MEIFHAKQNNSLEVLAGVLLRCFLLAVCLLLLWFVIFLVAGQWAYSVHSKWFEITRHDFDIIMYCAIAFFKTSATLFFLLPFIAVKLILRRKK